MILEALARYYGRMCGEGAGEEAIAARGFEMRSIPFLILLNSKGEFLDLLDNRESGSLIPVPKGVKRTSGIAANLLWDTSSYVLGHPGPAPGPYGVQRAKAKQLSFISRIKEVFPGPERDEGVGAVLAFLEEGDCGKLFSHPLWREAEERSPYLTFQLETDPFPVCRRPAVVAAIQAAAEPAPPDGREPCLMTGESDVPAKLHAAIKGVWGAQSTGATIVSFNHDAFRSFGKEQGHNAPVGKRVEFAYTTALNALLARGSRQRLQVGEMSTVFWTEQKSRFEETFADLFKEPGKDSGPSRAEEGAAPFPALRALEGDATPFFLLGLVPNAGRLAVRFWHVDTVGSVIRNIRQHVNDCSIVHGRQQPEQPSFFRLLLATAPMGKAENIQPGLAVEYLRAIVTGSQYPHSLLNSVLARCRADGGITHAQSAIIKAVLVRQARSGSGKEIAMALDANDTTAGYLLGRLFCVLEWAEERAVKGLNLTIRERFYSMACSTPSSVFPHLMKLKNYHLAMIDDKGQALQLERMIGEILSGVQLFPAQLTLQDQGRFAVGYYHQRQSFFDTQTAREE